MRVKEIIDLGEVEVDYSNLNKTVKKVRELPLFADMSPHFALHYPHANKNVKQKVELALVKFEGIPRFLHEVHDEFAVLGYRPGSIHEFMLVPQYYGEKFAGHVIGSGAGTTSLRSNHTPVLPVLTGERKTDFCVLFISNWGDIKDAYYLAVKKNS